MTIGQLAREHNLSRSTLLYYDRIGLLQPTGRSGGNYREYSAGDRTRLSKICLYRQTGLSLAQIRGLLDGSNEELAQRLELRLADIAAQIEVLRERQRLIVRLLGKPKLLAKTGALNRERWVKLLEAAGFGEREKHLWHANFEQTSPREHQEFLEYLCIPEPEIRKIRAWSRRRLP
jgi:MerR family transcriptional regulator, thiopeptide resistance regulator